MSEVTKDIKFPKAKGIRLCNIQGLQGCEQWSDREPWETQTCESQLGGEWEKWHNYEVAYYWRTGSHPTIRVDSEDQRYSKDDY